MAVRKGVPRLFHLYEFTEKNKRKCLHLLMKFRGCRSQILQQIRYVARNTENSLRSYLDLSSGDVKAFFKASRTAFMLTSGTVLLEITF